MRLEYQDIDGTFNKFLGYWTAPETGGKAIEIKVSERHMVKLGHYWVDQLYIEAKLIQNGNLIFNMIGHGDNYYLMGNGRFVVSGDENFLRFSYHEPQQSPQHFQYLKLRYQLNGNQPTLIWELHSEDVPDVTEIPQIPMHLTFIRP